MEEVLSNWLSVSRGRNFLLLVAGRLSGIHGWKGTHRPIACLAFGCTVTIQFEGAEQLTIADASEIILNPSGELVVRDAREARFTWYRYSLSDPQTDPILCEEVFRKAGRAVDFSRSGDPFNTSGVFPYAGGRFIVLREVC